MNNEESRYRYTIKMLIYTYRLLYILRKEKERKIYKSISVKNNQSINPKKINLLLLIFPSIDFFFLKKFVYSLYKTKKS